MSNFNPGIDVTTWNTKQQFKKDPTEEEERQIKKQLQHMVQVLTVNRPDVFCIQEAGAGYNVIVEELSGWQSIEIVEVAQCTQCSMV